MNPAVQLTLFWLRATCRTNAITSATSASLTDPARAYLALLPFVIASCLPLRRPGACGVAPRLDAAGCLTKRESTGFGEGATPLAVKTTCRDTLGVGSAAMVVIHEISLQYGNPLPLVMRLLRLERVCQWEFVKANDAGIH